MRPYSCGVRTVDRTVEKSRRDDLKEVDCEADWDGVEERIAYHRRRVARDLASERPRKSCTCRPVECIETGQVWESITAAAIDTECGTSTMFCAVKRGQAVNGRHYRYRDRRKIV